MSNSVRPHRRKPTRLPCPWDSPGKNTGVGCHFLLQCMKMKVKVKSLSRVRLLATPWTAAHQAPLSMGFARQEYWSGVPSPSPFTAINDSKRWTVCISTSFGDLRKRKISLSLGTIYSLCFSCLIKSGLCQSAPHHMTMTIKKTSIRGGGGGR